MLEYRYDVPFKFTGKINKLTFKLEPVSKPAVEAGAELGPTVKVSDPDPIDMSER
jgi:arylsulfatase